MTAYADDAARAELFAADWREHDGHWRAPSWICDIAALRRYVDGSRRITLTDAAAINALAKQLRRQK